MRSESITSTRGGKLFEGEKWLVLTGLLGFVLAGFCAIWVIANGGTVFPDGDVTKAISFNAALGLFLLSTAAISPIAGMGDRSRAVFRWSYIALALYSYFAETVQNFRGVNPRFVINGSAFDEAVANLFGFVAVLLVVFYIFFAVQYFRRRTYELRSEMVLGIRYAMIAIVLSFAAGIWISVNQGRYIGLEGNIIWLHGLGFHALQAVPVVAWLAKRTSLVAAHRRRITHFVGTCFLLGLAAIGWQTFLKLSVFELSTLPLIACAFFLIALAAGVFVLWAALSAARNGGKFAQESGRSNKRSSI